RLDLQRLSCIASICHGKGCPSERLVKRIIESADVNNIKLPGYVDELLSSENFDIDINFWESLLPDEMKASKVRPVLP
ncbi:hypothetical protein, partial [Endozoicomonas sp. YOMI1]|uniref:hypothetical protein n=1 Tax=Endozoicomonas sp. YOMI1 TaxID=2828739 RepID=UPI0021490727